MTETNHQVYEDVFGTHIGGCCLVSGKVNIFIIGFTLAYGLFYTVRPMIIVLAYRALDETFSYKLSGYHLHIKDRVTKGAINLKRNKLQEDRKYFFVKLENGQVIFFPKEKLKEQELELFRKNLVT